MNLKRVNTKLARHCVETETSATAFAVLIGKSYTRALPYLKPFDHVDYRVPSQNMMKIIFLWSDGQVTPNDLVPLEDWKEELAQERALEEDAA